MNSDKSLLIYVTPEMAEVVLDALDKYMKTYVPEDEYDQTLIMADAFETVLRMRLHIFRQERAQGEKAESEEIPF